MPAYQRKLISNASHIYQKNFLDLQANLAVYFPNEQAISHQQNITVTLLVTSECPMKTGKERIRRWRERNKVEGRKSVTIIISKKAHDVLSAEKEKTGDKYGAIVERALLNMKRHTFLMDNVTSNRIVPTATVTTKKLIDEGDYPPEMSHSLSRDGGIIFGAEETLNKGFLTRLLKTSKRKLFKS